MIDKLIAFATAAALILTGCGGDDPQTSPAPPPVSTPPTQPSPTSNTAFGFVPFPFDLTAQSLQRVHDLTDAHADFTAVHLDLIGCVPWAEMLAGEKLPEWLDDEFAAIKARIPPAHFTYVSTTPTAQNRIDIAPQCGATEGEPGPLPAALRSAAFDDPQLVGAYLEYNRRVLAVFEPRYLVVGIEISELALQAPAKWPAFERLYTAVDQELDQSHPDLAVGPEMVLQTLMGPVGTTVRPIVEQSDFLGISFYPYASPIGEAMGAPALPDPPAQWQEPLDWLRDYTDTPIAIAETGYITRDVDLLTVGIRLQGDAARQRQFLTDLVAAARRDDYLFVVWFVPVDYTALVDKTGTTGEALDLLRIWQYAGLFDEELQSKPAWPVWTAAAAE